MVKGKDGTEAVKRRLRASEKRRQAEHFGGRWSADPSECVVDGSGASPEPRSAVGGGGAVLAIAALTALARGKMREGCPATVGRHSSLEPRSLSRYTSARCFLAVRYFFLTCKNRLADKTMSCKTSHRAMTVWLSIGRLLSPK